MGRHTAKAGLLPESQLQGRRTSPAIPGQGSLSFANDTNNPLDTTFGFANAATGVFTSYSQNSKFVEGNFLYNNVEWYLQDNWKVNSRLTLDYGLRFVHQQPQYDSLSQSSNFFPEHWSPRRRAEAVRAGVPGRREPVRGDRPAGDEPGDRRSCSAPNSSLAIGQVVSGSGNADQRHRPGRRRHRQDQLHLAAAGAGAAVRRRLRRDRQPEAGGPRRRRAVLRSAGRQLGLPAGRQPAALDVHDDPLCHAAEARRQRARDVGRADARRSSSTTPSCRRRSSGTSAHRCRCRGPRRWTCRTSATTPTTC